MFSRIGIDTVMSTLAGCSRQKYFGSSQKLKKKELHAVLVGKGIRGYTGYISENGLVL